MIMNGALITDVRGTRLRIKCLNIGNDVVNRVG